MSNKSIKSHLSSFAGVTVMSLKLDCFISYTLWCGGETAVLNLKHLERQCFKKQLAFSRKTQECANTGIEHIQIILTLSHRGRFPCTDCAARFYSFHHLTENLRQLEVHGQ